MWLNPLQPHQDDFVIKPYNMSLYELSEWRSKFALLRNKYFGYSQRELTPPRGFVRDDDGVVVPGGLLQPENTNSDVSSFRDVVFY